MHTIKYCFKYVRMNTEVSSHDLAWTHGADVLNGISMKTTPPPTMYVQIQEIEYSKSFFYFFFKIMFVSFLKEITGSSSSAAASVTTSKVQQLKQATFTHLSVSVGGSSGNTQRTKVFQTAKLRENKQTNSRFSV